MGCPITLHLTFKPWRLIEKFITIQSGQSGSLLTISVLDGESFHFDDDSWEQRGDKLEMIWSWEREEIFVELQLLATKLIEITVGPVSPWCAIHVRPVSCFLCLTGCKSLLLPQVNEILYTWSPILWKSGFAALMKTLLFLEALATELIELTLGPVVLWCALNMGQHTSYSVG